MQPETSNTGSLFIYLFLQTHVFHPKKANRAQRSKTLLNWESKEKSRAGRTTTQTMAQITLYTIYTPYSRDGSDITERLLPLTTRFPSNPGRLRKKKRKIKK